MTLFNPDRIAAAVKAAYNLQFADNPLAETVSSEHILNALSDFSLPVTAEGAVEQIVESLWRDHLTVH
ncbi:MAG TPA: hypothetical protein P5256_00920 [Beijerinckiaceae bacterium]|nr:hypothetical protein [Rhodoblastus sp.]MCB1533374.1 hypothetical protein [Rhodoblastus sp.]MCC2106095.1 hypothetical protein [Hyphomicrobiales bacterium]HPG04841.1 hypothetical protein [Rhodoblastus sp.]HRY01656.1 hypothetical protein [Beijerinckiaceae bacterium]